MKGASQRHMLLKEKKKEKMQGEKPKRKEMLRRNSNVVVVFTILRFYVHDHENDHLGSYALHPSPPTSTPSISTALDRVR